MQHSKWVNMTTAAIQLACFFCFFFVFCFFFQRDKCTRSYITPYTKGSIWVYIMYNIMSKALPKLAKSNIFGRHCWHMEACSNKGCTSMDGFLKYECKLHLKQPSSPSYWKIIVAWLHLKSYCHRNWSMPTIPIHVDNKMWHYCYYDIIEKETHLVLEFLLYNPIGRRFAFLFQTIMSCSLESFYQLDHHVGISHYLTMTIALHFS